MRRASVVALLLLSTGGVSAETWYDMRQFYPNDGQYQTHFLYLGGTNPAALWFW
jgi:hypothetical protein